jgi:hypothetical protein
MTMKCPVCGNIMIWLNGSISHDPPIKYYSCRDCMIGVSKYSETNYDIYEIKNNK